jgi:NTP pyrophosphatase (non-canonical NTP hydrolase)
MNQQNAQPQVDGRDDESLTDDEVAFTHSVVQHAGTLLQTICYEASKLGGWHNDPVTGAPRTWDQNNDLFPTRIALIHSEVSEAMEGHRKDQMDDHLPHRKMAEVELADVIIRVADLAGAMGYDLGGAIVEKLTYNLQRADHKHAARNAAGGKKY